MAKSNIITTDRAERNRLTARAQSYAQTELSKRHPDEYAELYKFYCEVVGFKPVQRQRTRPPAPPYQNGKAS